MCYISEDVGKTNFIAKTVTVLPYYHVTLYMYTHKYVVNLQEWNTFVDFEKIQERNSKMF